MQQPLSVKVSPEGQTIEVNLGQLDGWEKVDGAIGALFVQMLPDWGTWLGVANLDAENRPLSVTEVLAAVDEFQEVGNSRLALLMLAQGYSEIAMSGQDKKFVNSKIVEAMQHSPMVTAGMQDKMPNATSVYTRALGRAIASHR
ncbi:MAG: hypothetical protein UX37_C0025G0012 [Microgenomates group bacterium GW2011_GWA2_46_16]|nr:MAG: hypothetical protein UX37_C0025G0012 [Microgenomates group bacterium GW2011_GWA2_46_16]